MASAFEKYFSKYPNKPGLTPRSRKAYFLVNHEWTDKEFATMKRIAYYVARAKMPTPCDFGMLDDLFSEAWLSVVSGRCTRINGAFVGRKMAWLYLDLLRARKAEKVRFENYERQRADERELHSNIQSLLEVAAPNVCGILRLIFDGYTHDEIAVQLNISKRTVNYRLKALRNAVHHA